MAQRATAEHLAALKKELGYNKDVQFINKTRGTSKKKKHRYGKSVDIITDEKAFIKFCKKHLHPYILYRYENFTAPANKKAFRENIIRVLELPTPKELHDKHLQRVERHKAEKRAFKEFMKEKSPDTLSDYLRAEEKFYRKRDKMIQKYQKRGFIYTDNAFVKVDLKEFTTKLIERHEEMRRDNERLLNAFKKETSGRDLPPHIKRAEEMFERVEKDIRKSTKRLSKGVTENDLQVGVRF